MHGRNTLPRAPREAVRTGRFTRVPVVTGANRDEGRLFSVAFLDATERDYVGWVHATFGEDADAVLTRYPWPEHSDRFTAAYLTAAAMTDQGLLGIGGCAQRRLTRDFARHTRTYAYEFAHRTGPGPLDPIPGYEWGAAHAAELAYLWPELGGETPISDRFDAAEWRLASDMTSYWSAFIRWHTPHAPGQQAWPDYRRSDQLLSLRAGGASTTLSDADYVSQHQCEFWNDREPVETS